MSEITELLEFSKRVVQEVANDFLSQDRNRLAQMTDSALGGREIKIAADTILESLLLNRLLPSGLSVLSEETGLISQGNGGPLRWIVDPLDGSVNYLKGIGPSAISVALWAGATPLFGVVFRLDEQSLAWGGRGVGAWVDGNAIRISSRSGLDQAILCTGIPARFRAHDASLAADYFLKISRFAKVRMVGSAACSLLMVARGAVDAYFEDQIMIWDIAAGLAIVQGAGGNFWIQAGETEFSHRAVAAAPSLEPALQKVGLI